MKKFITVLVFAAMIVGVQSTAHAILLYQDSFLSANRPGIDPSVEVQGFYVDDLASDFFNGYTFDLSNPGSVGSMFTSQLGDTGFSEFSTFLTDGIDQNWQGRFLVSNGSVAIQRSDAVSFGTSLFSTNNIDLAGYSINMLKFTVDSIQPIAFQDGYRWTSSFSVFGDLAGAPNAVPEPATMLLFGAGMAGAFVRRRKQA